MFEVDPGSRAPGTAQTAPGLQPRHGLQVNAHTPLYPSWPSDAGRYRRRFARRALAAVLIAATISGAALVSEMNVAPASAKFGMTSQLDAVARAAGFGIDMVVLSGHQFTQDSDIFDALDLPNARSLTSFDTDAVRRRLERLPWIQSAELTRVFPDRLDVRVRERKAFAVWMRDGQMYLIDESGRQLSAINRADGLGLLRVAGEGAPQDAKRLVEVLTQDADIYQKIDFAERVGERRWSLHLTNGVTVHLPPDREAQALAMVGRGGRLAQLLLPSHRIIDLRVPGRIAVRQDGASTGTQAAAPLASPIGPAVLHGGAG